MNFSAAVFVINRDARAIICEYDPDSAKDKRVVYKTLDQNIKKGDLVIVPTLTRQKFTVVKVVDTDVPVNFDHPDEIRWIVGVVDTSLHTKLLADEGEAIKKLQIAEQRKRAAEMMALMGTSPEDLKGIPLYNAGSAAPPAGGPASGGGSGGRGSASITIDHE